MSAPKVITEANDKDTAPTYELLAFPPPERPTVDVLLDAAVWLMEAASKGTAAAQEDRVDGSGAHVLLHDARVLVEAGQDLAVMGRIPTFRRADGPAQWIGNLAEGLRDALHDASYDLPFGLLAVADALVSEVRELKNPRLAQTGEGTA